MVVANTPKNLVGSYGWRFSEVFFLSFLGFVINVHKERHTNLVVRKGEGGSSTSNHDGGGGSYLFNGFLIDFNSEYLFSLHF